MGYSAIKRNGEGNEMGCDIHLYKEKQIDGKWVAADVWTPYDYGDDDKGIEVDWHQRFTDRNYELFGLLCKGVRSEHPLSLTARGIPFDACEEIGRCASRWDADGHNHSYLYVHELRSLVERLKTTTTRIEGMKDKAGLAALRESIATGTPDWSLLYPYCGWASNSAAYDEFVFDVPASFIVGDSIERIIASFDDIDGDNHRIVFWFDN